MTDAGRWNEGWLDHTTHVKIGDPFSIFTVSLISLQGFCILGMRKRNPEVVFLKNIKDRDPVLARRLHTDISTAIFCKPVTQFLQPFGKGRETSLLIFSTVIGIRNTDTGKESCFADI